MLLAYARANYSYWLGFEKQKTQTSSAVSTTWYLTSLEALRLEGQGGLIWQLQELTGTQALSVSSLCLL